MNRWHSPFRTFLASLIFSLALALGLGSVSADLSMPYGEAAVGHHAAISSSPIAAASTDSPCDPETCTNHSARCCHNMIGGSCSGYGGMALAAPSPAISAWFVPAMWVALPANSLAGLGPKANRRPPRLSI